MGRLLQVTCNWIDRAALAGSAALLGFMCCIVFIELVARYGFNYSFTWIEELARYLLVWATMLIGSSAIWRAELIGMSYVLHQLPKTARIVVVKVTYTMVAGFLLTLVFYGIGMVSSGWMIRSPSLQVSMSWFYAAIPVGSIIMLVQVVGALIGLNQDKAELPAKDSANIGGE